MYNISIEIFYDLKIRFEFSLNSDDAALVGLMVEIDGNKIVGKVKEKTKAANTYVRNILENTHTDIIRRMTQYHQDTMLF